MKAYNKKISGFTLIELAVVMVIIGIILGSTLSTLSSRIEFSRNSETQAELEEIKQAMISYAYVYGYLPCPDCNNAAGSCATAAAANIADGESDYDSTLGAGLNRCFEDQAAGNVPWVTLGLGHSDAWGTRYRYSVQNEYADVDNAFALNSADGSGIIQEPDFAADVTGVVPRTLANNVVAVIFSHGKNGFGGTDENNVARVVVPAANIDELDNTDDNEFYYTRPATTADAAIANGEFDDIVTWISEFELKGKMVEAGRLP